MDLVARFEQLWDFVDRRDIEKHAVAIATLLAGYRVMEWAVAYAIAVHDKPGTEVAAVIVAVTAPYSALQAAVIKWYFDARSVTTGNGQSQ